MADVGISVDVEPNPETSNLRRFITSAFLFQCVGNIFYLPEIRRIWARQYSRVVAFAEQGGGGHILPRSVINLLLVLIQIKAQSLPGFPFITHHHFITFSNTTVLLYAFISAVEVVISSAGYDRTSSCVVVARLGKIGCSWIFATSLAALLYL